MNNTSSTIEVKETKGNKQKPVVSAFKSGASFYEFDSITNKLIAKVILVPLI